MNLSDLRQGEKGIVTGICDGSKIRRRLQDLGIVHGTVVECVGVSPLGDPTAYLIKKTVIALRRQDAEQVFIGEALTPRPPFDL